jgi:hypothetical protein
VSAGPHPDEEGILAAVANVANDGHGKIKEID